MDHAKNIAELKKAAREFHEQCLDVFESGSIKKVSQKLEEVRSRYENRSQTLKKGVFRLRDDYLKMLLNEVEQLSICKMPLESRLKSKE